MIVAQDVRNKINSAVTKQAGGGPIPVDVQLMRTLIGIECEAEVAHLDLRCGNEFDTRVEFEGLVFQYRGTEPVGREEVAAVAAAHGE
jgi:hypothetical protein